MVPGLHLDRLGMCQSGNYKQLNRLNSLIDATKVDGRHRLLFQRLFFGALVGCSISLFYSDSPLLEALETGMLEWRYKIAEKLSGVPWFPKYETRALQSIAIVAFDEDSQFDLGFARFNDEDSQSALARVIDRIEQGSPTLVVVDLDLRGAANQELIGIIRRHRNVVLSLFGSLEGSTDLPAADFLVHAASYGYHELPKEPGGLVLRLPRQNSGTDQPELVGVHEVSSLTHAIVHAYRASGVDYIARLTSLRPDQAGYINYHAVHYDMYPMREVLQGAFSPDKFLNRVVFIGSTLTARHLDPSRVKAPFRDDPPDVVIHADALATVINNEIISSFPKPYAKQFLLLIGALTGAIASALPMGKRAMAMLLSGVLLMVLAQFSFMFLHVALPVVSPLALIASGFILGTVINLDTDLRQRNRELAAAREMMQVRAEEERKRIAGDLHDETLPALSSIARMVDDMSVEFGEKSTSPRKMREKLDDAIQEMRRVINDLHPSVLETMGFVPALENLVRILEREIGIAGNFETVGAEVQDNEVSDFAKLQLYRIVQESLNNVRKHSAASRVDVIIEKKGEVVEIRVTDNGKGIDPRAIRPDSHGLLNIRHRAALVGAGVEWRKPKQFESGTEFIVSALLISQETDGVKGLEKKV